jgi:hypothetical protein
MGSPLRIVFWGSIWKKLNHLQMFCSSGTFSGRGVIDGQKVQVTGIREESLGQAQNVKILL